MRRCSIPRTVLRTKLTKAVTCNSTTMTSTVWCLLIDHERTPLGELFEVDPGRNVADLKKAVKREKPARVDHVDPDELVVLKCQGTAVFFDTQSLESLDKQVRRALSLGYRKLLPMETIVSLELGEEEALIIQLPGVLFVPIPNRTDRITGHLIVPDLSKKRNAEQAGFQESPEAKLARQTDLAPSTLAKPEIFKGISGPQESIGYNRPFEYNTIPLELMDASYGVFLDRCEKPPSDRSLEFCMFLAHISCDRFENENGRMSAIQRLFKTKLDLDLHAEPVPGYKYTTDGTLPYRVVPALIQECKNDSGFAVNQAIAYYVKYLLNSFENYRWYPTRFPSILMVDIGLSASFLSLSMLFMISLGASLGFYAVIWDGSRVRAEPLTPMFDLSTHWRNESARRRLASTIDALLEAVQHIDNHYKDLEQSVPSFSHEARRFPYPLSTHSADHGETFSFRYASQSEESTLVFRAYIGTRPVVVKFTRQYSADVHRFLANLQYAPALLNCECIPGGWLLVVMDESPYGVLYKQHRLLTASQEAQVESKTGHITELLHQNGFVHGDIRDSNILVDSGSLASDNVKLHLIDFDWAGRAEQVKYPMGVNTVSVQRPAEVKYNALITKEHDIQMVKNLFGKTSGPLPSLHSALNNKPNGGF